MSSVLTFNIDGHDSETKKRLVSLTSFAPRE